VEKKLELQRKPKHQKNQVKEEEGPAVKSSSISAATIAKVLSGIDFPKSKDSLKQYAKDHLSKAEVEDAQAVLDVVDDLPDLEYTNMADLEREVGKVKVKTLKHSLNTNNESFW
jgi:Protein of unknown function (DUF2795)